LASGLVAVEQPGLNATRALAGASHTKRRFQLRFELAGLAQSTAGFAAGGVSAFGYAGVALYGSSRTGIEKHRSLAGTLDELTRTPGPPIAPTTGRQSRTALAEILSLLFPTASSANMTAMTELERQLSREAEATLPFGIYQRSQARGTDVARHVFDWSITDGGHEGFRNNFPAYTPPTGPGLWVPTPPSLLPALQPYWGSNRPFVRGVGGMCPPGGPPAYSESMGSPFTKRLTSATGSPATSPPSRNRSFWSDDPGLTDNLLGTDLDPQPGGADWT
jgi:hypothetical protein